MMERYIGDLIEDLIFYGAQSLELSREDCVYARNQLLELFEVEPSERCGEEKELQREILRPLVQYAVRQHLAEEGGELRFETKILGLVTPSAGLVVNRFLDIKYHEGAECATEYLYNLSVANNYIRLPDIRKNICWCTEGAKGKVGVTINLSKPEKDAKEVLAEKNFQGERYPKCLLCLENLGFCGTSTHPARQTLRIVPVKMAGEAWHLQYSPYVYYDQHCIAFSDTHTPMQISERTFVRLLDFVTEYPHYFMGSNADLPIVGGSILSHEHYQGGKKVLPMLFRPIRKVFYENDEVRLGIRDWYNSVVTVKGKNRARVQSLAERVLNLWRQYTDEKAGIIAYTGEVRHNTVTPIASIEDGEFCLDLILRNNRTDDAHPFGIYHPTEDMHNIKKEGIGLIEAMGLFILPGRLKREIMAMRNVLAEEKPNFKAVNEDELLKKHIGILAAIAAEGNTPLKPADAERTIIARINKTCLDILECTAVFKNTAEGQKAFERFMKPLVKEG